MASVLEGGPAYSVRTTAISSAPARRCHDPCISRWSSTPCCEWVLNVNSMSCMSRPPQSRRKKGDVVDEDDGIDALLSLARPIERGTSGDAGMFCDDVLHGRFIKPWHAQVHIACGLHAGAQTLHAALTLGRHKVLLELHAHEPLCRGRGER